MYTYITEELPATLFENFKQLDSNRVSITGHSMGGHGALSLFLKNPGKYKSVSAFAPIANPLKAPWGEKAFKGYFGESDWQSKGAEYDSTELLKKWKGDRLDILIDVVRTWRRIVGHHLTSPIGHRRQLLSAGTTPTTEFQGGREVNWPGERCQHQGTARLRSQLLHHGQLCR